MTPRWLLLLCVLAGGCVPVWRQTLLRPAGIIQVRDSESGSPLGGARVVVRRFNLGPPPRRESHRFLGTTGPDGRVTFDALTAREWVMPLMMHGVPQWAFDVCVDAAGRQGQSATWMIQGMWTSAEDLQPRPLPLVIDLPAGDGRCEEQREWQGFMTQVRSRPSDEGSAR